MQTQPNNKNNYQIIVSFDKYHTTINECKELQNLLKSQTCVFSLDDLCVVRQYLQQVGMNRLFSSIAVTNHIVQCTENNVLFVKTWEEQGWKLMDACIDKNNVITCLLCHKQKGVKLIEYETLYKNTCLGFSVQQKSMNEKC